MTTEQRTNLSNILVAVGLLIMVAMALMPLLPTLGISMEVMKWTFAAGAAMVLVARIIGMYNGPSLRIKRLHRILVSSGVLYCASAAMMFLSQGTNDWIAFLLAALAMQLYASWMIDRESRKAEK